MVADKPGVFGVAFCGLVVGPTGLLGMRILPVKKGRDDSWYAHSTGEISMVKLRSKMVAC